MSSINFTGLSSGLDTSSMIKIQVEARGKRLNRMLDQKELLDLQRQAFQTVSNDLMTLRSQLLDLRLQSTFYNRDVTLSNNSMASAKAAPDAPKISHTLEVNQLAKGATASSFYTRASISAAVVPNTSNITGVSTSYPGMLEGKHDIAIQTISAGGTSFATAKNTLSLDNKPVMKAVSGADVEGAEGMFGGSITIGETLNVTVNGTQVAVTFDQAFSASSTLTSVANYLDKSINAAVNAQRGTQDIRYIAVGNSANDWTSSDDYLTIYNTEVAIGETLTVDGGSAANALGFGLGGTAKTVTAIEKNTFVEVVSASATAYTALRTTMGSSAEGLMGGDFTFAVASGSTIQDGSLRIITNSGMRFGETTSTTVKGATNIGTIDTTKSLSTAGFTNYDSNKIKGFFTVNGVKIELLKDPDPNDPSDDPNPTVQELLAAINGSGAGVTASYDATNGRFLLTSNTPGASSVTVGDSTDTSNFLTMAGLTAVSGAQTTAGSSPSAVDPTVTGLGFGKGIFTINGVSIYVDNKYDSINDVIRKINNSGAGVTASFDVNSNKLHLSSELGKNTTNASKIQIGSANDTSNFLGFANLAANFSNPTTTVQEIGTKGQDAVFQYDGVVYVKNTNEIEKLPGGIDLTLKGVTASTESITVAGNTDNTVDRIAKFIALYNKAMEYINPFRLSDDDRKYLKPLDAESVQSMTFSQQDQYEEKYRSFNMQETLRKSSEMKGLSANMKRLVTGYYGDAGSTVKSLGDIGITLAGRNDYKVLMKGMLLLDSTDEEEIKAALQNNGVFMAAIAENEEEVFNLFSRVDDNGDSYGIARKMQDMIEGYVFTDGVLNNKLRVGGLMSRDADSLTKNITREKKRLDAYEASLKRQYAALEKRMSELQSQSSALLSFAGLPSG
ncbi:flagellar filament capping protein FliD [Chrysiogenes arsenatis]|uniref:flagellar filament capping protein FliD n=1 Tax=Chrysiogenes arsenatis TaxID=309797 RepID=UPI00040D40F5|nr:flagellar filament capping protein FliD [Chrysiogenes arsenatis]